MSAPYAALNNLLLCLCGCSYSDSMIVYCCDTVALCCALCKAESNTECYMMYLTPRCKIGRYDK